MAGLLDFLSSPDAGNGIGGLLSYLQSPLYQTPKQDDNKALSDALGQGAYDGAMPQFTPPSNPFGPVPQIAPQQAPSPFAVGAPALAGLPSSAPQVPAAPPPAPIQQPQPPAPQNNPINSMPIGSNYQMPQFGSAADYTPQATTPTPTDVSAQSRQPAQPLPPALGGNSFGGNLGAGLQSFANTPGGLIPKLVGGASGLFTGNRSDPQGIQQQNLKAQYDSLVPVLGPQKALLAVMNPEAGKTLLNEALTNKQEWGVVSEDPLQGKKYGFINKYDQTINDKPIGQGGNPSDQSTGLQGLTDQITAMRTQGASKDQMLGLIPTGYRDDVASLIAGKGVPANMGRAQSRMAILTLAKVVDPSFDETLIPTRIQMRKDFAGEGKNGQAIGAFNTVQHHAGQVSDAIEEFEKAGGGSNVPLWNAAKLALANNTGSNPQLRDAAQKLQDKLNATEHEVASAYNAGHITDSDRKTWNEIKASNLPTNQLRQKLDDFTELLNGKRDSLNHMYQQTFHEDAPTIDKESNAAITAKIHNRLPGYAKESGAGLPSGWSVKVH